MGVGGEHGLACGQVGAEGEQRGQRTLGGGLWGEGPRHRMLSGRVSSDVGSSRQWLRGDSGVTTCLALSSLPSRPWVPMAR